MRSLGLFFVIILTGSIIPAFAYTIVPPTPAFSGVSNGTANTQARFWNSNLTISHGSNMLVNIFTANNTIYFDSKAGGSGSGSGFGTYNVTKANNAIVNSGGANLNFINSTNNPVHVVNDPTRNQVNITITDTTGGGAAPKVSINGFNRSSFINIIANQTFPAPKVSINGNNRSSFIGVIANQTFPAPKIVINGNNRSSFSGIIANQTFPAPKVSINGNNRSSFTGIIANQTFPAPQIMIGTINASKFTIYNASGSNLGAVGLGLYSSSSNNVLSFLKIVCNSVLTCSTNSTALRINATAGVTSVTGTANNITSSGGTTPIINLGSNAVVTGGSKQTFAKNLDFSGASSTIDDFFGNAGLTIRNTLNTFGFTIQGGAITGNRTINLGVPIDNVQVSYQPVYNFTSPANKTGTVSTTFVMNGGYATLTPRYSTNATITISAFIYNSVATDGCMYQIRQGTSFLGNNGAAVTGTKLGNIVKITSATAQANMTLSKTVVVTGLTTGQKNYFDLAFARVTGGYCKIINTDWYVREQ